MSEKHLILEMTPIPKGRPRFTMTGHAFTDAKTRKAEADIRAKAIEAWGKTPFNGPVILSIFFTFPKPKSNKKDNHTQRPDLDNCIKLVSDAINGVAFVDDCQIVGLSGVKAWGDRGLIDVWVKEP